MNKYDDSVCLTVIMPTTKTNVEKILEQIKRLRFDHTHTFLQSIFMYPHL